MTSPTGAALRDVLTSCGAAFRRSPCCIYPVPVQGAPRPAKSPRCSSSPTAAREVDTLLLVRGGGSLEDLWAFNDEALARAIAGLGLPLVSGIGHEIDFTIADFVADLRAPTPSAAAELAAPDADALLAALGHRPPGVRAPLPHAPCSRRGDVLAQTGASPEVPAPGTGVRGAHATAR